MAFRESLHGFVTAISRRFSKLLPDRIPVTFVGPDATRELCESIGQTRLRKVLIVTDATLVDLGLVGRISESLKDAGVASSIYAGVLPDPTTEQVEAGLAQYKRENCDAVLAFGGGSPMDAGKMIAAMATNPKSLDQLEGIMKVKIPPAPLYAIPTTAGTGSEVTVAAVVSDATTHTKKFFIDPKLLPRMAALDPSLMTGLPPHITAATGMDALTHAVESYVSQASNPQTEEWAGTAIRLIFDNLPAVYSDGSNLSGRKAMALASYYAGLAFTRTSVGYVHAIAHTFGAYYGTPHGLANAIALPHVLEFSKEAAESQLARMADLIGLPGTTDREKAQQFIDAVRDLKAKVEIPETLAPLKPEDIEGIAKQAVDEAHLNYPVPRYMSQAQCEELLQKVVA